MRPLYVWLFSISNLAASIFYFVKYWRAEKELYWAVIALLNTKTALILVISQVASTYTAVVVSIHWFVFNRTKEGERFVVLADSGNRAQGEIQAAHAGDHAGLPLHVLRLHHGHLHGLLHDYLDLHVVAAAHKAHQDAGGKPDEPRGQEHSGNDQTFLLLHFPNMVLLLRLQDLHLGEDLLARDHHLRAGLHDLLPNA